jgi:hypothetical protein
MPRWITGSNRLHPPHDSSKDDGDDEDTAAGTMALMPVLATAREADAAAAIPPSARLATLGELSCAGGLGMSRADILLFIQASSPPSG